MSALFNPADELTMQMDEDRTYPFIEDENGNITGYGHQDKALFAALINDFETFCNGSPLADDELWTAENISHCWAILDSDPERGNEEFFRAIPADTPGAFPITTMWGER